MTSQSTRSGRPEGANEAKANCGVLRIVGSIAGAANSFADVVSVLCLAVAAILVFMQVLLRYVFRIGFVWTEELARHLIVYCSLIGSSIVVRNDAHPRVEVFVELLPHALRRYLSVLLDLLVLGFLGVLIWQGIESTMFGMRTKTRDSLCHGPTHAQRYPSAACSWRSGGVQDGVPDSRRSLERWAGECRDNNRYSATGLRRSAVPQDPGGVRPRHLIGVLALSPNSCRSYTSSAIACSAESTTSFSWPSPLSCWRERS